MHEQDYSLRRAAVLVSSVDRTTADALLKAMLPADAATVRRLAVELEEVAEAERDQVLSEFVEQTDEARARGQRLQAVVDRRQRKQLVPDRHQPGIDLSNAGTAKPLVNSSHDGRPFRSLETADPDDLAAALQCENAQAIALVFAHLPAERAAAVLVRLSPEVQVEVAQALTELDAVDEDTIRIIEQRFESWIEDLARRGQRRRAGIAAVQRIAAALTGPTRQRLLSGLSGAADESAAEECKPAGPLKPDFDDLLQLDDRDLAAVVSNEPPQLIALALFGIESEVVARVLGGLSPSKRDPVQRILEQPGPLRLADVEMSRNHLIERAAELLLLEGTH